MPATLRVDVDALETLVDREIESIARNPPRDAQRVRVAANSDESDAIAMVARWLMPMVVASHARSVLQGVRQDRVSKVGHLGCLAGLSPIKQLGEGSDGQVWLLESGEAAKVGTFIDGTNVPDELSFSTIEQVIQEIAAARAAGKASISPRVSDAWFCCSASQCAYVIKMDAVDGGVDMGEWVTRQSEASIARMKDRLEALTLKLNGLGIFHNDLHENNVMIDRFERPWIIDFSRCTYVDTMSAFKMEHQDIRKVRKFLSNRYVPEHPMSLTRYIAARLLTSGDIEVVSRADDKIATDVHPESSSTPELKDDKKKRGKSAENPRKSQPKYDYTKPVTKPASRRRPTASQGRGRSPKAASSGKKKSQPNPSEKSKSEKKPVEKKRS